MTNEPFNICVIGGGFTGAVAAIACLRRLDRPFRLMVVEPSASLGRGVAFGGQHPLHLLNVRTRDLSVRSDHRQISRIGPSATSTRVRTTPPCVRASLTRSCRGSSSTNIVRQRLVDAVDKRRDVDFNVVTSVASSCSRDRDRLIVETDGAGSLRVDVVILATAYGLQSSSSTCALAPFEVLPAEQITKAKSIALIGSGPTMVDVLLSARRDGFSGAVTVISRRSQLPREHAAKGVAPQEMPRTKHLSRLTSSVRIACEAAEARVRYSCFPDKLSAIDNASESSVSVGSFSWSTTSRAAFATSLAPPSLVDGRTLSAIRRRTVRSDIPVSAAISVARRYSLSDLMMASPNGHGAEQDH
jgi:hypothetical protein